MECCCFLRDGKSQHERRFGESFKGPIIPFGALVKYLPISATDQARIHQFRMKVLPGILIGYPSRTCFVRGVILGRRYSEYAEIEELEKLDASEKYPRRLKAKEVLITREFIFPLADGSAKLSGRDYEFQEPTLRWEFTLRRENLSVESHGDREEFQPEETKDDAEINKFFGLTQKLGKNFIYRHHIEP